MVVLIKYIIFKKIKISVQRPLNENRHKNKVILIIIPVQYVNKKNLKPTFNDNQGTSQYYNQTLSLGNRTILITKV